MENQENKLYVGNLPYSTNDAQLRELFEQAGAVKEVVVISDRDTGRSKGFGFVTMEDAAGAEKAIQQFNGYQLNDRALTVNAARPREERPARPAYNGGGF